MNARNRKDQGVFECKNVSSVDASLRRYQYLNEYLEANSQTYRFSLNHICSFSYIKIITLDNTTILERKLHSFSLAREKLLFNKRGVFFTMSWCNTK